MKENMPLWSYVDEQSYSVRQKIEAEGHQTRATIMVCTAAILVCLGYIIMRTNMNASISISIWVVACGFVGFAVYERFKGGSAGLESLKTAFKATDQMVMQEE